MRNNSSFARVCLALECRRRHWRRRVKAYLWTSWNVRFQYHAKSLVPLLVHPSFDCLHSWYNDGSGSQAWSDRLVAFTVKFFHSIRDPQQFIVTSQFPSLLEQPRWGRTFVFTALYESSQLANHVRQICFNNALSEMTLCFFAKESRTAL